MNIKRIWSLGKLFVKHHWADICLWTGIASGAGAVITTAVQTTKLEPIVSEHEKKVKEIKAFGYSREEESRALLKVYAVTLGKLAKLYAVPAGLEAVSIATRISGHNTLKGENLAIAAAYTGILEAYKTLRHEVKKEDDKPPFDIVEEDTEATETQKLQEAMLEHPYCRVFHNGNENWHPIFEENVAFLRKKMAEANERFHARGYLYLNEVFESIGIKSCPEGEYIGWVEGYGNNYVDFGITPITDPRLDGKCSPSVWLDFNVDGHVEQIIFNQNYCNRDTASWRQH